MALSPEEKADSWAVLKSVITTLCTLGLNHLFSWLNSKTKK